MICLQKPYGPFGTPGAPDHHEEASANLSTLKVASCHKYPEKQDGKLDNYIPSVMLWLKKNTSLVIKS